MLARLFLSNSSSPKLDKALKMSFGNDSSSLSMVVLDDRCLLFRELDDVPLRDDGLCSFDIFFKNRNGQVSP